MPVTKEFKTIEERIEILESRKLKFKNKENAKQILKDHSYFDIVNGFETMFLKNGSSKKEYDNLYFEDLFALYKFDMRLKEASLNMIFAIESKLRTSISYHFTSEYCTTIADTMKYTEPSCYKAPSPSDKHMSNIFNNFDLFRKTQYYSTGKVKKKSFIDELKEEKDYIRQYDSPPFWVVIKALPLGTLYYTFLFLDDVVKEKVLKDFGLELKDLKAFEQALFVVKEVRNQCAHLELVTRVRIKRKNNLNNFQDIRKKANLSNGYLNYMDVMKIFKLFGKVSRIKKVIISFYISMFMKGRKIIVDHTLSKMGRKNLRKWLEL